METTQAKPKADQEHGQPQLAGKYMTFKLGKEEYGLAILKVRELIGLMDITRVPGSRPFVRGVINLRGKVIPVTDLRLQFGMAATTPTDQTVIIVVQLATANGDLTMGILVDEVLEVLDVRGEQIEPPPAGATDLEGDALLGVGKSEKRVIFLLDIDRILASATGATPANAA